MFIHNSVPQFGAVSSCSTLRNMSAETQRGFGNFGHNVPTVRCQSKPTTIHQDFDVIYDIHY